MSIWEFIDAFSKMQQNWLDFEAPGIFSRKVNLEYKATSEQPWVLFDCLNNKKYSFVVHELQFGSREGNREALYWHLTAPKKKVELRGYVNYFYPNRGSLRGYLSVPEDYHRIGVQVCSGGILKLKSQEALYEDLLPISNMITSYILMKQKMESAGQDSNLGKVGLQPTGVTTVPPAHTNQ